MAGQSSSPSIYPLQSKMPCMKCGVEVFKTGSRQRYCAVCARSVIRASKRLAGKEQRSRNGVVPRGTSISCASCGAAFVKSGPGSLYCSLECKNTARRKGLSPRTCGECGLRFQREANVQRYCRPCGTVRLRRIASQKQNIRRAERMKTDPMFVLNMRIRKAIGQTLRGKKKWRKWESLVGYGMGELASHMERQFQPGMNWQNMGEWHIDHIVPLSSFVFVEPEEPEFVAAWALTNLRPLWWQQNLRKGRSRTHLL